MEKVFEDIKEPKLAMVISGTPDQLQPLIKSKENGLFSRFIVYNFDEISDFKNVFALKNRKNKEVFETIGNQILNFYGELVTINNSIEFSFTENQINIFLETIRPIRTDILGNHSEAFISNLHRHGLIMFRLAMIFTTLRNKSNIKNLNSLICNDVDFNSALVLMKTLLRHSQFTFNTMETGNLSLQDENILDNLEASFTRQQTIDIGAKYNVPKRTIDDKLSQWQKKRMIKKVKRGTYKKL